VRALNTEECAQVSGGGAFSNIVGFTMAVTGSVAGFFISGPPGALIGFGVGYGIPTTSVALYDKANEGRESKRIEYYDHTH